MNVAAVNAALNSFSKVLLANHVRTCVADNIRAGNDVIKEDSAAAVKLLQEMGIHVVMLTGDNEKTANALRLNLFKMKK